MNQDSYATKIAQQGAKTEAAAAAPAKSKADFKSIALATVQRGIPVVPAAPGDKRINFKDWPNAATTDSSQIEKWARKYPQHNAAAVAKSDGVWILDIDTPGLRERIEAEVGPLETYMVESSPGKFHAYFKQTADSRQVGNITKDRVRGSLFEVKCHNACVNVAGSIHPKTGEPYRVVRDVPLAPVSNGLLRWIGNNLLRDAERPKSSREFSDAVGRNCYLTSLAGRLWNKPEIKDSRDLFDRLMQDNNFPASAGGPLPQREVRKIASSIAKKKKSPKKTTKANGHDSKPPSWDAVPMPEADQHVANEKNTAAGSYALTELGNAERLVAVHGRNLHYTMGRTLNSAGTWFVWDEARWRPDALMQVRRYAKDIVRKIATEALAIEDFITRQNMLKFALKSEADARINAMISLARSEQGVPVLRSQFDRDLMLLNLPNGTIELQTGKFRKHRREDLISKVTNAQYDPEAKCPLWLRFLNDVTESSPEFIRYLKQLAGLSLTGLTRDHLFMILWGEGQTGKSTFLETLSYVLGEYALMSDVNTFMVAKGDRVRNDVARLHGARFITANESELGQRLAEALIKSLTGGDTLSARFLYEESFEFKPQGKFWLRTNYKPVVRGQDSGIWRRVRLVPFITPIPEDRKDKDLPKKLEAEASGILNWMLEGLAEYLPNGLAEPREVTEATQAYRAEQDVLRQFMDACCVVNPNATVGKSELYSAYVAWAEKNGLYVKNALVFRDDLRARKIEEARRHGGERCWRGLGLRERGQRGPAHDEDELPF